MKLSEFSVREFRSVWHSGPLKVDDLVTCLVGKNESGKTALLTALYRTNPIIDDDAEFDETYDYPKREVEDYRFAVENAKREEAVVVDCLWELDDDDLAVVIEIFGGKVLKGNQFRRKTYYGGKNRKCGLEVDDSAARKHLASNSYFSEDLQGTLESVGDWTAFAEALDAADETEAVNACKDIVAKVNKNGLGHYILHSLIWPRAPKFLYFDEYYQMKGHENLGALIQREDENRLEESDRPLLGLINLARLNLRELVGTALLHGSDNSRKPPLPVIQAMRFV